MGNELYSEPSVCVTLTSVTPHVPPSVLCHTSGTVAYFALVTAVNETSAVAHRGIELGRGAFDAKKVGTGSVDSVACLETG